MSSIKFMERAEDCFPMQVLDVPTRNEALLDSLLRNKENLLCNIAVSGSLGCSNHRTVGFGVVLSTLSISKVLDFARANLTLLRAQLGGILWEVSMEDKGTNYTSAGSSLLEAQNISFPVKVRQVGGSRRPPWLNSVLLSLLKTREAYQRWKSG